MFQSEGKEKEKEEKEKEEKEEEEKEEEEKVLHGVTLFILLFLATVIMSLYSFWASKWSVKPTANASNTVHSYNSNNNNNNEESYL